MDRWPRSLVIAFLLSAVTACNAGPTNKYSLDDVDPPASIDIERCANLERGEPASPEADQMCQDCCGEGGFTSYSHVLDGRCTCGNLPERASNDGVCAAEADDPMACHSCCRSEEFAQGSADSDACVCVGVLDAESCDDVAGEAEPELACQVCCVEHGYLSLIYAENNRGRFCTCKG